LLFLFFFIVFRETIESAIVVAVLLSIIEKILGGEKHGRARKSLVRQVWLGVGAGVFLCLVIGGGLIGAFYNLGKDVWGGAEDLYEGIFSLIASLIITVMGAAILRVSRMQEKWATKLMATLEATYSNTNKTWSSRLSDWTQKYAMFALPFLTVIREGLEAVVFVGGVSFSAPATAIPLPAIIGLLTGSLIGWLIFKGGNTIKLQWFLIISTCLLYLVAAGLMSKAAWNFDMYQYAKAVGGDVAEVGAGPGSYNIHKSVWHVNCCSPTYNVDSGWGVFNALLGWQNSATYSSVIVYNVYWIVVAVWFLSQLYLEKKQRAAASEEADREVLPSKYEDGATVVHGAIVEVK